MPCIEAYYFDSVRALSMGNNKQSTETTVGALKAEMAIARAATSAATDQLFEIAGYGQMRSALNLKREFRYVMKFMNQIPERNGNV
jgi:hypothetical protein